MFPSIVRKSFFFIVPTFQVVHRPDLDISYISIQKMYLIDIRASTFVVEAPDTKKSSQHLSEISPCPQPSIPAQPHHPRKSSTKETLTPTDLERSQQYESTLARMIPASISVLRQWDCDRAQLKDNTKTVALAAAGLHLTAVAILSRSRVPRCPIS